VLRPRPRPPRRPRRRLSAGRAGFRLDSWSGTKNFPCEDGRLAGKSNGELNRLFHK
jgi:hypothetical protein